MRLSLTMSTHLNIYSSATPEIFDQWRGLHNKQAFRYHVSILDWVVGALRLYRGLWDQVLYWQLKQEARDCQIFPFLYFASRHVFNCCNDFCVCNRSTVHALCCWLYSHTSKHEQFKDLEYLHTAEQFKDLECLHTAEPRYKELISSWTQAIWVLG